ncbi:MAG: PE-PPE domain-containing protein [Mycobacterium sp.]|uniref:PE-PPE domain-containing protein n=1 Tax=Mycobacterium sp. TaxID=1785 RepID=UPI003C8C85D2
MTAIVNSAFAFGDPPLPGPTDPTDLGLVLGGSGLPIPTAPYVDAADLAYINGWAPVQFPATYPGVLANGVFTPEGLYPVTDAGVHQLLLNYPSGDFTGYDVVTKLPITISDLPDQSSSVGQGLTILNDNILANVAAGDVSTVFGYSQSAAISSLEMGILQTEQVPTSDVNFVLIGDVSAPNGGLLERFNGFETTSGQTTVDPLQLPSLGFNFDGATPDDGYTTAVYSLEYDGFADFPRYPLDFLADLNAFLGIAELHGTYLNQAAGLPGGPTEAEITGATPLTTDPAYGTDASYFMIDQNPPLVTLLSNIPVVGKPLADLLGPDLTVLINLGYGGDNLGYSDAPANVPTPFGLFPDVNPTTLANELVTGAQLGFQQFGSDLSNPAALLSSLTDFSTTSTTSLSDIFTALETDFSSPEAASTTLTELVNALSGAASTAYSTLLPTADIANALLTSMPAYDVSLITDNLSTGDLLDAVGLPVAADTALVTLAAGFEYDVISNAASQIGADFAGLF